mmetsp:Transcript_24718/g.70895  ORF Transcript_24718/g.70895 Transcript_24718/m.70895 type:complete len:224 (+) Transcript_24718:168-839(+)
MRRPFSREQRARMRRVLKGKSPALVHLRGAPRHAGASEDYAALGRRLAALAVRGLAQDARVRRLHVQFGDARDRRGSPVFAQLRVDDLRRGLGVFPQWVAPQVRDELGVRDPAVLEHVCLGDESVDLLALVDIAEHLSKVIHRDVPRVVCVELHEGGLQQVVVQRYAGAYHRREEVRVVYLLVVVRVQGIENRLGLVLRHMELVLQDLLQLLQCDGSLVVPVH